MVVVMDNYTRVLLTVIAVLLTLIAIPLWTENGEMSSNAYAAAPGRAGIPDAGQQLGELIELTKTSNAALLEINQILSKGVVKVELTSEKEKPMPTKTAAIKQQATASK